MGEKVINVAKDFSRAPAGRYISDGPNSGERFRNQILVPALNGGGMVTLELDGTRGYGSSFLEEAFGGLIRLGFKSADLLRLIVFKTSDPSLVSEIKSYWR